MTPACTCSKFRGSGQGPRALIAELLAGEIGRALGLDIPELVFMTLDPELARTEPDAEIQALIKASTGLNIASDYLPGSSDLRPGRLARGCGPGIAHRLVRCLHHQRRSHGQEREHAGVAPASCA